MFEGTPKLLLFIKYNTTIENKSAIIKNPLYAKRGGGGGGRVRQVFTASHRMACLVS